MTNFPRYILYSYLVTQKDNATQTIREKQKNYSNEKSIDKLVVQVSFKKLNFNTKKIFFTVYFFLELMSGQKPTICVSKKDSSVLKLRKNDIVAISVTLRKRKLYFFLENLVSYIYPKTKPFAHLPTKIRNTHNNENFTLKNTLLLPELEKEFNIFIKSLAINDTQVFFSYKKIPTNNKKMQLVSYQFPFQESLNLK